MPRGRAAGLTAIFIASIFVLGACATSDPGSAQQAIDRISAQANAKAAVARKRAVAQRRGVVRRRARAARLQRARTTPTTVVTAAATGGSFVGDVVAIQKTVNDLNAAFATGVASGIALSTSANNWVGYSMYSSGQCESFEKGLGQGVVSEHIVVYANTVTPSPGWVDPVIGQVPRGRIYQVGIDEIQTLVTTGAQRTFRLRIHVTVQADGRARMFLRCH